MKTVDELDPKSREFYERARFKLALSLIFAAIAMMLLGFCSAAGAEAQVDNLLAAKTFPASFSYYQQMFKQEAGSQGFACFAYVAGFFAALGLSLYISPLLGSENEKRMLSNPSNISDTAVGATSAQDVGETPSAPESTV